MTEQPWPVRNAQTLRLERRMLMARYDSGAMPPGIAQQVKKIETQIAEIERDGRTQNGPSSATRA